MKISQQTWHDLLMTPCIQNATQVKYVDNGVLKISFRSKEINA